MIERLLSVIKAFFIENEIDKYVNKMVYSYPKFLKIPLHAPAGTMRYYPKPINPYNVYRRQHINIRIPGLKYPLADRPDWALSPYITIENSRHDLDVLYDKLSFAPTKIAQDKIFMDMYKKRYRRSQTPQELKEWTQADKKIRRARFNRDILPYKKTGGALYRYKYDQLTPWFRTFYPKFIKFRWDSADSVRRQIFYHNASIPSNGNYDDPEPAYPKHNWSYPAYVVPQ